MISLGRPAYPAGGSSANEAVAHAVAVLLLLLGAGLTIALVFGLPPASSPSGRQRSRRSRAVGPVAGDPLLPPGPSGLFPPSHHERIHDPKYLRRMLEAEQRSQRRSRRRSGHDPGRDPSADPGEDPSAKS